MCFKWIIKTSIIAARHYFGLVALFCSLILLGSFFIEYILMIEPCILCTIQRIMFFSILITCLLELIVNWLFIKIAKYNKILFIKNSVTWFCLSTTTVCSIIGTLVAARQSWLQIFASSNISSCSGGLQELLKQYSVSTVISMAIQGKLECSAIGMKILGLSLANWGFINFLIILIFGILFIYKKILTKDLNK